MSFDDVDTAARAFMGAGPTQLAIRNSGEAQVAEAVRAALEPFVATDGRVVVPAWYRAVLAQGLTFRQRFFRVEDGPPVAESRRRPQPPARQAGADFPPC